VVYWLRIRVESQSIHTAFGRTLFDSGPGQCDNLKVQLLSFSLVQKINDFLKKGLLFFPRGGLGENVYFWDRG